MTTKIFVENLIKRVKSIFLSQIMGSKKMNNHSILAHGNDGGDYWEKMFWPFLKDRFSNYEKFWQEFIIPLTNRPRDIQIRDGVDPLLEEMAMAHYSTFYHLGTTFGLINLNNDIQKNISDTKRKPGLYSEMFFRLSSATEMIDRLIFAIWKIAVELALVPDIKHISDHKDRTQSYVESGDYTKDFDRFNRKGQSVNMIFHTIRDVVPSLSGLMANIEDWNGCYSQFKTLAGQDIRRYRNTLAHNPIQGTKELNRDKLIPKKNKLSDYALWSNVFKGNEADFVNVDQLILNLTNQLADTANRLWWHLIELMKVVSKSDRYGNLMGASGSKNNLVRGQVEASQKIEGFVSSSEQQVNIKPQEVVISGTDIHPKKNDSETGEKIDQRRRKP